MRRGQIAPAGRAHLRQLLAEGRLPECWIPPSLVLECRALLELYHGLRAGHTAWVSILAGPGGDALSAA